MNIAISNGERVVTRLKEYAKIYATEVDYSEPQSLTSGVNEFGGNWAQVPLTIWNVGRTFEIYRWCEQVFGAEGERWKEMYAGRFYFENTRDQMFFVLRWS
jgi:hypothetical protein